MVLSKCDIISDNLSHKRSYRLSFSLFSTTDFGTNSLFFLQTHRRKTSSFDFFYSQLFCDFHGHSRQKNFFFYGNDPRLHFLGPAIGRSTITKIFPKLFTGVPGFALQSCLFTMRKQKEGCARIVVWDEFKIDLAYTMEATYNGFDLGIYKVRSV